MAVQNQRNRQTEFETKNLQVPSAEVPTKTVKAVTQVNNATEATAKNALEINYEKAASEAINTVKHDLATKEIEQRLKQEIDRQRLNETLSCSVPVQEAIAESEKEWKLQQSENGDRKVIWQNENWSQDNVDNHCRRP